MFSFLRATYYYLTLGPRILLAHVMALTSFSTSQARIELTQTLLMDDDSAYCRTPESIDDILADTAFWQSVA